MAKKKKKASKKSRTPAKKSKARKTGSSAKSGRKSAAKKSTTTRGNSVDSILKKYQKERHTQEVQLATMRKKIEELEAKTRAFREQIGKLTDQENGLKRAISQLDAQRDQEVSDLLAKLGVQFRTGNNMPSPNTTDNTPQTPVASGAMRNQPD